MEGIILDGLRYMVVGMGTVFCFLILMVLCMHAAAAFFQKFEHLFPEAKEPAKSTPVLAQGDTGIAIAIAAVHALKN